MAKKMEYCPFERIRNKNKTDTNVIFLVSFIFQWIKLILVQYQFNLPSSTAIFAGVSFTVVEL